MSRRCSTSLSSRRGYARGMNSHGRLTSPSIRVVESSSPMSCERRPIQSTRSASVPCMPERRMGSLPLATRWQVFWRKRLISRRSIPLPRQPTFRGHDLSSRLKVLGVEVVTLGDYLQEDPVSTAIVYATEESYRKLIVKRSRLVGFVSVGPCDELPRLSEAVDSKRNIGRAGVERFRETGCVWTSPISQRVAEWPTGAVVCSCLKISRGTLSAAVASGCDSADALRETTGASSVCGSCRYLLADLAGQPEAMTGVRGWQTLKVRFDRCRRPRGGVHRGSRSQAGRVDPVAVVRDRASVAIRSREAKSPATHCLVLPSQPRLSRFGNVPAASRSVTTDCGVSAMPCWGCCVSSDSPLTPGSRSARTSTSRSRSRSSGTLVVGAAAGVIASQESRTDTAPPAWAKQWRPRLTLLHVLFTWPLPVLVAFHIVIFYLAAD